MATPNSRVKKEIEDLKKDSVSGVKVFPDEASPLTHLKGVITGPPDTPYEGGTFEVDIVIPGEYPFNPPKMKFLTKLWHPNVSSVTGAICLDILKDQWSPALTLKTALLSLQALLSSPEPSDPQDAEVANMYLGNYAQFVETAKFWTDSFAKDRAAQGGEVHPAVKRLMEMGFEEGPARQALVDAKGDENAAVEALLSSM